MRVKVIGYSIIFLVLVCVAEVAAFLAGEHFIVQRFGYLFNGLEDQAVPPAAKFNKYLELRDEVLGWPSKDKIGGKRHDESGARPSPAFPEIGTACVSVYGDSFAFGLDVGDAYAWSNLLAIELGCRVANYAVSGYGTDQAFLRFREHTADESELVVVGIWPEDVARNLTQYHALLYGYDGGFGFKPRFILDAQDKLELIPLPTLSLSQYEDMLVEPGRYLKHETFLPGSPSGPISWRFPYSWRLVKFAMHERVQAGILGQPTLAPYFDLDHPSRGVAISVAILEVFERVVADRGKRLLVIVFPAPNDAETFKKTGDWFYQPLIDEANKLGLAIYNLGPDMVSELGERDFCEAMRFPDTCNGHYGKLGYRLVADLVARHIAAHDLLPNSSGVRP